MSATEQLDLYVTASGNAESRPTAIGDLVGMFPLDVEHISALEDGRCVLLRSAVSRADAETMAMHLDSIGFVVELRSPGGAPASAPLPRVASPSAPVPRAAPPVSDSNAFFNVGLGLVGLDGEDSPDDAVAVEPPASAAAPAQPPAAPSRFAPDGVGTASLDIGLDRPPVESSPSAPSHSQPEEPVAPVVPRCATHDVVLRDGICARCAAAEAVLRGKLFGGTLREKPMQRLLIGVGAGLFIGWIVTTPIARRAQMRITDLREQAARERARPTEEAAQVAAQLDAQAEEQSQSSFMNTFAVWGVIAAAVTGAWMKLT